MLVEITAENIAIMDRAELRFGPGFTAITGETGAGKSLLVGSISLCLGERADASMVRSGAARALVQAVFEPGTSAIELLAELGYPCDDGLLYVQREIAAEGRSVCRVNGKMAPLNVVKRIGDSLADLHGQHEHQSLLDAGKHIDILDDWLGDSVDPLKAQVAMVFARFDDVRQQLKQLEQNERDREQKLDLLRFQVSEISEAKIVAGETSALESELKRLKNAEQLARLVEDASIAAFSGDAAARDLLVSAMRSLESASEFDDRLKPAVESLRTASIHLDEAVDAMRSTESGSEYSAQRVEEVAERLDLLSKLRRKYGESEESILKHLSDSQESLDLLENVAEGREKLTSELAELESQLSDSCRRLSDERIKGAKRFGEQVTKELRDLAMSHAKLAFAHESKPADATGADRMEMLFTANVGESEKPLAKIASGGEISRVMLAIKTVAAGKGGVPTLIFDEVDSGLGGQTAAVVAKKLEELAANYQVIVITHVPQIASRAASQIAIEKSVEKQRTVTRIRQLSPDERVTEIARMLAGEEVGKAAVENAKQLLKS